ncbi:MAG: universal stress protein [Burkholderiales bacterium]|nr:universal stress protein [Bacteroidia bacterium]
MIHLNTKKIIITTDFSDTALLAIKHGAFLAQYTKGEIFLVHIITRHWEKFNVFTPSITIDNIETASIAVQAKLEQLAQDIRKEYNGITVTTVVNSGNPTAEIIKFAKEINAGLIVMGTHGYSAWEDLTIGSNALKVLTKSPCPVLTMSEHANKFGYKKIVLPIDTSEHTRHKVVLTLELAKQFSAQIYAVGILADDEENKKHAMQVMLRQVDTAAKDKGVACTTELVENVKNRAVATVNYCEKVGGDLISIMTDQDAELSGFFLGPYALQVIHHSKVPVLSIKAEDQPDGASWGDMLAGT